MNTSPPRTPTTVRNVLTLASCPILSQEGLHFNSHPRMAQLCAGACFAGRHALRRDPRAVRMFRCSVRTCSCCVCTHAASRATKRNMHVSQFHIYRRLTRLTTSARVPLIPSSSQSLPTIPSIVSRSSPEHGVKCMSQEFPGETHVCSSCTSLCTFEIKYPDTKSAHVRPTCDLSPSDMTSESRILRSARCRDQRCSLAIAQVHLNTRDPPSAAHSSVCFCPLLPQVISRYATTASRTSTLKITIVVHRAFCPVRAVC
jgi:hypothetical protein